jgi:predicted permease
MSMLFQVVLPVLLIFLTGYIGQKVFKLHIKSISTTALYLMTPPLVFRTFYNVKIDAMYLNILIYSILLSVAIIAFIKLVAFIRNYNNSKTSALISATAFMNNGNYGAPLMLFAYGELAFQYSVAIMILHTIIMSTLGLYYVAKGNFSVRKAIYSVIKMPIIHAVYVGLIWQYFNLPLPENIYNAVSLVADASIPLVMLVLGMQLAEIKLFHIQWGIVSLGTVTRLLISPAIAYVITLLLPVDPLLAKVMIVLGAMPSAAIMVMYSIEFDCDPQLVSSITLISTILSLITLSVLLTIL